jgi:hypothetical protein
MPEETQWWARTPMAERRATLNEADLWDGNTYAERTWEELPSHIRIALEATHNDRVRRGAAL